MPIVYKCSNCGRVLFVEVYVLKKNLGLKSKDADRAYYRVTRFANSEPVFNDVTQIPTPFEVAAYYGFRCPYCGAELLRNAKIRIFVNPKQRKRG